MDYRILEEACEPGRLANIQVGNVLIMFWLGGGRRLEYHKRHLTAQRYDRATLTIPDEVWRRAWRDACEIIFNRHIPSAPQAELRPS